MALPHRAALGREDFLIAASNRDAVAWIDAWPGWPAAALAIVGPAGCGKTHLAEVWRARSHAPRIAAAALTVEGVGATLEGHGAVVVEDADRGVDERALLHLYNALAERRGHLLLTARLAPARWSIALADLRSRLNAAPVVEIGPPDDTLIEAVLVKLFADRQLRVSPDVIGFLLVRLERSLGAAAEAVAALDAAALQERRNITVPLARAVLRDREGDEEAG